MKRNYRLKKSVQRKKTEEEEEETSCYDFYFICISLFGPKKAALSSIHTHKKRKKERKC